MPSGIYPRKKSKRTQKPDPRGTRYTSKVKDAVRADIQNGMTAKAASDKHGPSVFVIKDWKKRWGLTKSRKGRSNYRDVVTALYTRSDALAEDSHQLVADLMAQIRTTEDMDERMLKRRDYIRLALSHMEAATALLLRGADA